MIRNFKRAFVFASVIAVFSAASAYAQTYYVRAGASGNGSDWANAYGSLPSTLQRGATYYVAGGSYNGRTFNTSPSGSTVITIKKATQADHGTDTGWNANYGTSQATFSGQLNFTTPYWVIDGVTGGGPGSWKTGFGFKVTERGSNPVIFCNGAGNVTLRHIEIVGAGNNGAPGGTGNDGLQFYQGSGTVTLSYAYVHDLGRCVFYHGGGGPFTVEYTYTGQYESTDAEHAELAVLRSGQVFTFRWGVITHEEGTGGFICANDTPAGGTATAEIYGNIFYNTQEFGQWGGDNNGLIASFSSGAYMRNWKVYHNTFINLPSNLSAFGISGASPSGNVARNNYYYNTANHGVSGGWSQSYEHFQNSGGASGSNATTGSGNPFSTLDISSLNFAKLTSDTSPGDSSVPTKYRTDMFGNVGTTRGAIQFSGGGGAQLTVDAGNNQTVTIPNNASLTGSYVNLLGGLVTLGWSKVSGPGTVTFSADTSANTTASFSTAGTYVLRLTATVLAISVSDDVTVSVQSPPDTTPPTVTLTAPSSGNAVSNTVTLSASASDNTGVTRVDFLVDNVVVGTDSTSPYSYAWNSKSVANGSHTVKARAYDAAGNQATTSTTTINVSNPLLGMNFEAEAGIVSAPFSISSGTVVQSDVTDITTGGRAVYVFNVPTAGDYVIKARIRAPSLTENSVWLNIDAEPQDPTMAWDVLPPTSGFETRNVAWRGNGTADADEIDPKVFTLSAGQHTMIVIGREPNMALDSFEIVPVSTTRPEPPTNFVIISP